MKRLTGLKIEPCSPPLWAKSGHSQTLLGHFLPSPIYSKDTSSEIVDLADGDKMHVRYRQGKSDVVVYLFHGLGGSIDSDYMQRTAQLCDRLGYHFVLANHRGCGEGRGLASRPYHSGVSSDLSAVIRWGRRRFPKCLHLAIGFSLSGNALLLLSAGVGGDELPDVSLSVNAPICLEDGAKRVKQGINKIYDQRFVRLCREAVEHREFSGLADRKYSIPRRISMYDFDSIYTAPAGGFRDRQDYYDTCSAKQHLSNLKIPTVLLTSKDDPFVNYKNYSNLKLPPYVYFHLEEHGGHMGYLSGKRTDLGTRRWLDYALWKLLDYLVH